MPKGLDVGTMNLIAAEHQGEKTTLTQQRNTFVEVPLNDVAERMLARSEVLTVRDGDHAYVVGEDALNFANTLNIPTRRPMQSGILSRDEKEAIPILRMLIERLIGAPSQKGETVHFTCPARPVDAPRQDVLYHQKTLEAILRSLGYTPRVVNEGMAVVYSELADHRFTGLGISFGAGMTNMCMSYYGLPVLSTAVARGGDWIDEQVAEVTGEPRDRVTAIKERDFSLSSPKKTEVHSALAIYYENLMEHVIRTLDREARNHHVLEGMKIPIAVTGGTAAAPGFREAFLRKLKSAGLPFDIENVRVAANPLYSVALGTLVGARAEQAGSVDGGSHRVPVLAGGGSVKSSTVKTGSKTTRKTNKSNGAKKSSKGGSKRAIKWTGKKGTTQKRKASSTGGRSAPAKTTAKANGAKKTTKANGAKKTTKAKAAKAGARKSASTKSGKAAAQLRKTPSAKPSKGARNAASGARKASPSSKKTKRSRA
jgi:hypothetical protein